MKKRSYLRQDDIWAGQGSIYRFADTADSHLKEVFQNSRSHYEQLIEKYRKRKLYKTTGSILLGLFRNFYVPEEE